MAETSPEPPLTDRPELRLVLTTAFWGLSFPLMKDWHDAAGDCPGGEVVAASTLIFLRMTTALMLLLACRPQLLTTATRREHLYGAAIGLAFGVSFFLQVLGLAETTPAHSAFFTSLASAWVPPLGWLLFRLRSAPMMVVGICVAVLGAMVLLLRPGETGINRGDALTLVASVCFTLQMLLLDRLGRQVNSANLTVALLTVTAVPTAIVALVGASLDSGVAEWLAWVVRMLSQPSVLLRFLVLSVLATALAFHWMNMYQPRVTAARAALIYFLEPVFGMAFSVAWGHDELTSRLLIGGLLILLGNLLVELPLWRRGKTELRS